MDVPQQLTIKTNIENLRGLFDTFRSEMENLMEKIRAKAVENPQRTLIDTSKTVRISMADRKHSLDTVDKGILRQVTSNNPIFSTNVLF